MGTSLITDHVWRRFPGSTQPVGIPPEACAYMNCRRPRQEHERVAQRGDLVQDGILSAKVGR